jgi:hypothetical protein
MSTQSPARTGAGMVLVLLASGSQHDTRAAGPVPTSGRRGGGTR